jgi:hypothetical protein
MFDKTESSFIFRLGFRFTDLEVLVAANFEDHTFMATDSLDELVAKGFIVGAEVVLARRITCEFGPKKFRKDVNKGTQGTIKGISGTKPVVRFTAQVGKHEFSTDVALSAVALQLKSDAVKEHRDAEAKAKPTALAKFPFLEKEGDIAPIEVISDWENLQCSKDDKVSLWGVQGTVAFALRNLQQCGEAPLTDKDILIVRRGQTVEVWTLRAFKAGALLMTPETTEIKPRFWTKDRGAIVRGSERLTPGKDRRPLVLDGRIRGAIAQNKSFSMFWMVQRSDDDTEHNMVMEYPVVTASVDVSLGSIKRKISNDWPKDMFPQCPILINPKKIDASKRLVTAEDEELKELSETTTSEAIKDKETAERAAKAAKKDAKDA